MLFGPLLLALAAVLSRGSGWTWLALGGVAVAWLVSGPAPAKSNVRTVAATVAPAIRPGDLVASTQPEQVPVLHRYLPAGVRYLTPLGPVADPRLTDWRDGAGAAARRAAPSACSRRAWTGSRAAAASCSSCPSPARRSQAPWSRAVRIRTREWRAWLRADPRLRPIGRAPRSTCPPRRSEVRTRAVRLQAVANGGVAELRAGGHGARPGGRTPR